MNPFEMVVIIVAITAIAGVLKAKYGGHRKLDVELNGPDESRSNPDAARLRDEVRTLKDRIAVLERIATDRTTNLDHEIERLRDR